MTQAHHQASLAENAAAIMGDNFGQIFTGDFSLDISTLPAEVQNHLFNKMIDKIGHSEAQPKTVEEISQDFAAKIFEAIVSLDFEDHETAFEEKAIVKNPNACLVQNNIEPEFLDDFFVGETMLLHRLSLFLHVMTAVPVSRELLSRSGTSLTQDNLWRLVGQRVGVSPLLHVTNESKAMIGKKLGARLNAHHVILILSMPTMKEFLKDILLPFWRALIKEINDSVDGDGSWPGHLMLMLFDKQNRSLEPTEEVVILPPIKPFPQHDLLKWYLKKQQELPMRQMVAAPIFTENLVTHSQGIPTFVVQYVCNQCTTGDEQVDPELVKEALMGYFNNEGRAGQRA